MEPTLVPLPLVTPCALRLPLAAAPADVVAALNHAIEVGAVRDATGAVIRQPVDGLLLAPDGRGFPVRGGVAQLLPTAWVLVGSPAATAAAYP